MAVDGDANRRTAERFREAMESGRLEELSRLQLEATTEDFVDEWPQSGERIRGQENIRAITDNYPQMTGTEPKMKLRRMLGEGNLYVAEGTIDYGDGTPVSYVGIAELENGKIKKMTEYFANPFPAPEWRSQWVERME